MDSVEGRLRAYWDSQGVTKERQEQTIASITQKAQVGAKVGPFRIGGMMLADFAGTNRLCKRPQHGFPYFFEPGGDHHLKELINGKTFWPRLTAEDLTATDWEEVPE